MSITHVIENALAPMSAREALLHNLDMCRTFIEPGADPRAMWATDTNDPGLRCWRDSLAVFETIRQPPDLWETRDVLERNSWLTNNSARECRYVPADVVRWRDPEHRAELKRRARAYATDRVTYAPLTGAKR